MKIIIFCHLLHREYPWSVGRVRRMLVLDMTDAAMVRANSIVERIRSRRDKKRLRAFWRIGT